ncbi:MAG: GyrI-like domain-containing protein [Burkholderiaceae bacterium]
MDNRSRRLIDAIGLQLLDADEDMAAARLPSMRGVIVVVAEQARIRRIGMPLEPEFVDAPERTLVALSRDFTLETRGEIPALWQTFWGQDWQFEGAEEQAAYGVSYGVRPDGHFSYAAARHIEPTPSPLPDGACLVKLSAGRYAIFRNRGPVSDLPAMFDAIFEHWLPTSGQKQREGAVFERYSYDDDASPESMAYEIWVPIVR